MLAAALLPVPATTRLMDPDMALMLLKAIEVPADMVIAPPLPDCPVVPLVPDGPAPT